MTSNTTILRAVRVAAALAVVLLVATSGWAQTQFISVTTIQVRPGTATTFEEYVKKINEAADTAAISNGWAFFQVDRGRPGFTYMFVNGFDKWRETDAWSRPPEFVTKALGEEEADKLFRAWMPTMSNL